LPPTIAGLSSMLIPVVGVFSGMIALGERPTATDVAALASISAAVVAALLPRSDETSRS
jgi:drug/metabolite transporter (DMT)-like permease